MTKPYTDPTTGQWVGERETRGPDGEISRETEWFDTEAEARQFSTGKGAPVHPFQAQVHATERDTRALRELFEDWIKARVKLIGDGSTDMAQMRADYQRLIEEADARAQALGLPWDDAFVPEYVYDTIEAQEGPHE